ncbi:MAG: permease [Candidatus Ozemobacteraceae bacterium]
MDKVFCVVDVYQMQKDPEKYSVVAVLESHIEAEEAVKKLQQSGISLKDCSIVGKENLTGEQVIGSYYAGDRMAYWGTVGAFVGGLWGLLGGSAFLLIPGIGAVVVGGTFVAAIVGSLEGAAVVGGLSALGAAFYNIGVPAGTVVSYETAVKGDRFIVIVHGNSAEVAKAKMILESVTRKENAL